MTNELNDHPLDNFSNCHEGIISHLNKFEQITNFVEAATSARKIAEDTIAFFRAAVFDHHAEEERDLFPAVLASAMPGEEQSIVQMMVDGLTAEHREIESQWVRMEPKLLRLAKGHLIEIDGAAVQKLVAQYTAHASMEEREFLPLAEKILGRTDPEMAKLGLALHTRRVVRAARRGLRGS